MYKTYNRQELTEVKKGQSGTGLLVENDGHIINDCDTLRQIREDIDNNMKLVVPDRFVVNAVFQKYGIKNANGRVYPEDVLKREVDKYLRERVSNHSAIGSLDHPSCQLPGTKILTEIGWKNIEDVEEGENILTLNENKVIEVKSVLKKIESEYNGKMIRIKGRRLDLLVTPNHKFPIFGRNKKFKGFYTAQQLIDNEVPDQSHSYLYKSGEWIGRNDEYFIIPRVDEERVSKIQSNTLKEKYRHDLVIPMDVWAKFLGIYLSEGCNRNDSGVHIFQRKKEVIDEIREMLNEFPLEYKENRKEDVNTTVFSIYDMRLAIYLNQFGTCYDKFIPFELKQQSKETLRLFYDWFVLGDGRERGLGPGNYYSDDVFSTSKQLVMDLNEIQLKIGYNGAYHEEDRHNDRFIDGRLIEGKNCSNMHFTYRSLSNYFLLGKASFTEEDYNGMVYCVEVENHDFYTMDLKGHCVWSGNSSSLSGHDVSHVITNLEWRGRTLVGQLELHTTPGFRKYGVCSTSGDLAANMLIEGILIGVSSRAVGTVENRMGQLVVGDDLELICWDIVLEPSTPGAFISNDMSSLEKFVENDETRDGKPSIDETIGRINKILLY